MMPIPITAAVTALLALLMVALASRTSQLRMLKKVSLGDGGDPSLLRVIRAHANTTEHAPIFLLTLLAYELVAGSTTFAWIIGGTFALSRLAHAFGMIARGMHLFRMTGAGVSYLAQAVLAVALLVQVLSS